MRPSAWCWACCFLLVTCFFFLLLAPRRRAARRHHVIRIMLAPAVRGVDTASTHRTGRQQHQPDESPCSSAAAGATKGKRQAAAAAAGEKSSCARRAPAPLLVLLRRLSPDERQPTPAGCSVRLLMLLLALLRDQLNVRSLLERGLFKKEALHAKAVQVVVYV